MSGWSQVSGKSLGVGTKMKAGLFLFDAESPCCLGLIGSENLLVCGKPVQDCGTSHQGGRYETTETMADMIYVRDPKLATRFLKAPVAERAWFLDGALQAMIKAKKTVPEWAEVFRVAKASSEASHQGATEFDIEEQLDFVEKAQAFTTPAKANELKVNYEDVIDGFSPFLGEEDLAKREKWRQDPSMQVDFLELLEKLGDGMDKVMSDTHRAHLDELRRYKEIGCDFDKVHTWQTHMEGRVGTSLPVYGREFPSVWGALDYSARLMDARLAEVLSEHKKVIESLEFEKEAVAKELKEWKEAVSQGFQDVNQFMAGELDTIHVTVKSLEAKLNKRGPGGGPRIQNGVLFARTSRNDEGEDESESKSRDDGVQEDSFRDLRARLRTLEVSVKSHPGGGGGGDGPPAFGNLGLSGVGDLAAWNLDHGSGFQFGLFVDGPALLTFKREDFVSVGDQLAGLKRAGDIGLNQT